MIELRNYSKQISAMKSSSYSIRTGQGTEGVGSRGVLSSGGGWNLVQGSWKREAMQEKFKLTFTSMGLFLYISMCLSLLT